MPCDLGDVASVGELINSFVVSYHHFANDLQVFVAMDHGCCQHYIIIRSTPMLF